MFASYNLGQEYDENSSVDGYPLAEVLDRDPERFALQPQGHADDLEQPHIVLVPGGAHYSMHDMTVTWPRPDGSAGSVPLRADKAYLSPNGYRVTVAQQPHDPGSWTLVGTVPDATSCHKPATVSGGGKSEISKAITDAFIVGSVFTADFDADMDAVAAILARDFSGRFLDPQRHGTDHRPILSRDRSLGSVIKLLTPSRSGFTADHNAWLSGIPPYVKELVYVVKRSVRPEWGDDWRSHFGVAEIDGRQGNSLHLDGARITLNMLRVGYDVDGSWRLFSLRHDFSPAVKVQTQDDITASTVVPGSLLGLDPARSYKLVENCEDLLFQRPDDAVHRGYDSVAERDIATPGTFLSNFEPLTRADAVAMRDEAVSFSAFTAPMAALISRFADTAEGDGPAYVVSSADPRLVDGAPSKNPRYLQRRPDRTDARATAVAELSERLVRRVAAGAPLPRPVDVVAAGRRNNPPEGQVPALCSYGPLHYMEVPELFMELISSMTGKSPSTTGAGSEGALTKGPFNALPAIIDLNANLLSYVLTGHDGWLSAAGWVGPKVRVDHDFSLLVPELFARMTPQERDARNLIAEGALEKIADVVHEGRRVPASRLGYRMTERMATTYFGRIFLHPEVVFTPEMLRPELQDPAVFADSVETIARTHERVARAYVRDGTISLAIPPLRALLEIMADGTSAQGWVLESPEFREQFTRESVLAAGWYAERLAAKQAAASRSGRGRPGGDPDVRVDAGQRGAVRAAGDAGPGGRRPGGGRPALGAGLRRAARRDRRAAPRCSGSPQPAAYVSTASVRSASSGSRPAAACGVIRASWTPLSYSSTSLSVSSDTFSRVPVPKGLLHLADAAVQGPGGVLVQDPVALEHPDLVGERGQGGLDVSGRVRRSGSRSGWGWGSRGSGSAVGVALSVVGGACDVLRRLGGAGRGGRRWRLGVGAIVLEQEPEQQRHRSDGHGGEHPGHGGRPAARGRHRRGRWQHGRGRRGIHPLRGRDAGRRQHGGGRGTRRLAGGQRRRDGRRTRGPVVGDLGQQGPTSSASQSGVSGRSARTSGTGSLACIIIVATGVAPLNGGRPASSA